MLRRIALSIYTKDWLCPGEADEEPAPIAEPEAKAISCVNLGYLGIVNFFGLELAQALYHSLSFLRGKVEIDSVVVMWANFAVKVFY
jgi:hypothetical protein